MSWHLVKIFVPRIGKVMVIGTQVTEEHLVLAEKKALAAGHDQEWARKAAAVDSIRIGLERDGIIAGKAESLDPADHEEWAGCELREYRTISYEELLSLQKEYQKRGN